MLTDTVIRRLKIKDKRYYKLDSDGLYLLVCPNGKKIWTVRYWLDQVTHQVTIVEYPYMSISEARAKRDAIKQKARFEQKVAQRPKETTFGELARTWYRLKEPKLSRSTRYLYDIRFRYLAPLSSRPLSEITREELLKLLNDLQKDHPIETIRRVASIISMVMGYALILRKIKYDPSSHLKMELQVHVSKPMPAATNESDIRKVLIAIDTIDSLVIRSAIKLIAYTFVRSGEACFAKWDEFDFEKKVWVVPEEHAKNKLAHLVPLSKQAIETLEALRLRVGEKGYVFPSRNKGKHLFPATLSREMIKLQELPIAIRPIHTVIHGFRSTASTVLNEHQWNRDAIELQLGHVEHNRVRAAYNRAQYIGIRTKMMQWYADYLDMIKAGNMLQTIPVPTEDTQIEYFTE